MLVGSAATALRGVDLIPGDLDVLVRTRHGVESIAKVMPAAEQDSGDTDPATFQSSSTRPVLVFADDTWALGRWFLNGVKVEVAHIRASRDEQNLLLETTGSAIWRHRETVNVHGADVPTVPLEVQIATMVARDQQDRLSRVERAAAAGTLRRDLLGEALRSRGLTAAALPAFASSVLQL